MFPDRHRTWQQFWSLMRIRARYYIPVVGWLPRYRIEESLQSDVIAGITVAFLIIPQSLSYSQALVHVPPVYGLYTAMILQFVYALLGTSRQLAVGPEALVSMLVGSSIREFTTWRDSQSRVARSPSGFASNSVGSASSHWTMPFNFAGDPNPETPGRNLMENVQATTLLCLMVGTFTFLLGFFRLGFLDSVLSRALLRGFVLAVAVVVIIDMSGTIFGIIPPTGQCSSILADPSTGFMNSSALFNNLTSFADPVVEPAPDDASPIQKLWHTLSNLGHLHPLTTVLSTFSIAFLLSARQIKLKFKDNKWLPFIPEILVLVFTTTLFSQIFRWDCQGVDILGRVGAPSPSSDDPVYVTHPVPTLAKIKYLMLPAILIAVIGFVESIVVAKTYASKHRYAVSPNRELVALGIGNILASFFGGFPGFGSLGRSSVNDTAGAKTQVSGLVTGIIVMFTIIWLLPYFEYLPKAVCSSIIIVAALKLIELEDVHFILRLHAWNDLGLLLLTFCSTILISIEVGTLISVGVSLLLVVKHTTQTRLVVLGQTLVVDPATGAVKTKFRSVQDQPGQVERIEGGIVVRIEEGMFFGNVGQLKDRLKRVEAYGDLGVHPSEEPRRNNANSILAEGSNQQTGLNAEDALDRPVYTVFSSDVDSIKSVVFDMTAVSDIDATATQIMLEIVHEYQSRGITVCFVKLRSKCRESFIRSGIYGAVGPANFFNKIRDAIDMLKAEHRIADPRVSGSRNPSPYPLRYAGNHPAVTALAGSHGFGTTGSLRAPAGPTGPATGARDSSTGIGSITGRNLASIVPSIATSDRTGQTSLLPAGTQRQTTRLQTIPFRHAPPQGLFESYSPASSLRVGDLMYGDPNSSSGGGIEGDSGDSQTNGHG
eukprot:jgi/Hompol1/1607/HPOL_005656-RA